MLVRPVVLALNFQVCRIWLDQIDHVTTRFSHALCGHFVNNSTCEAVECNFCCQRCDAEVVRAFHLKITIADETAKVFAWCTGHAAAELLQISPDEFYDLPEVMSGFLLPLAYYVYSSR